MISHCPVCNIQLQSEFIPLVDSDYLKRSCTASDHCFIICSTSFSYENVDVIIMKLTDFKFTLHWILSWSHLSIIKNGQITDFPFFIPNLSNVNSIPSKINNLLNLL